MQIPIGQVRAKLPQGGEAAVMMFARGRLVAAAPLGPRKGLSNVMLVCHNELPEQAAYFRHCERDEVSSDFLFFP